jgi:phenylpropionate dioxygenase-like ring-hydroxylating dioxygenase large terminal subunit
MFHSTHHLPQRLSPEHYTSPEIAQQEIERMFLPGWHCLGALTDAPQVGDFFTCELFGRPLVCWHTSQGFQTFLNVCTHRFCTLTDQSRGRFEQRMKCQYHGWEYDEDGNTCKIPDAQHFRPLKRGELGLREFRTETIGQLIFVSLHENPPPLRECLGQRLTEWCQRYFTLQHRRTCRTVLDIRCNWKIVVENVLEAYHLQCVHPKSFAAFPDDADCQHEFHPTYDYYRHDTSGIPLYAEPERWTAWLSQREPEHFWEHILHYPNLILGGAGPWHYIQMVYPTGPETCRSTWYVFHYSGPKGKLWPFLVHRGLKRFGGAMSRRVQLEDAVVYPSIQRGTAAPHRPHGGGLISAREERIFTFQDYVLKVLRGDPVENVVPEPPTREEIQPAWPELASVGVD